MARDKTSVWSYEGMRVVVSGGGGAGMGAATVTELVNLGAEVHVIDLKEPPVRVASYQSVNLLDPDATAEAIAKIGSTVHALFNCAGLPGPPFSDLDTMLVNFAAMRHLAELCVRAHDDRAARSPASRRRPAAATSQNIEKWMPLVTTNGFAEAKAWCEEHPGEIGTGYSPSKEAIIIWTLHAAIELRQEEHPRELHQPRPDRHADDAGLRGLRRRGPHRQVRPGDGSALDAPRSRRTR